VRSQVSGTARAQKLKADEERAVSNLNLHQKSLTGDQQNFNVYRWAAALSQVITLPIAKSQIRSKQNKDMHKCSSVYSERGVLLPVLTSGGE
jgi:hypothetical protein